MRKKWNSSLDLRSYECAVFVWIIFYSIGELEVLRPVPECPSVGNLGASVYTVESEKGSHEKTLVVESTGYSVEFSSVRYAFL